MPPHPTGLEGVSPDADLESGGFVCAHLEPHPRHPYPNLDNAIIANHLPNKPRPFIDHDEGAQPSHDSITLLIYANQPVTMSRMAIQSAVGS